MSEIVKAVLTDLEPELQPVKVNELLGGVQAVWSFPNGYGASVVQHPFSHGVELGVLGPDGNLTYDTPITDDVIGWISSPEELAGLLRQIRALEG
jgi:hypothetical protein